MSQKKSKATRRSISVLKLIVSGILPRRKITEFAANEKIKAREFSYDAQIYLLMLGQLLYLFCLNDKAKDHDSKKADELLASLKEGDIAILDRAYNAFAKLYSHHQRGGFFVVREKDLMSVLRAYGIAPGENRGDTLGNMPY